MWVACTGCALLGIGWWAYFESGVCGDPVFAPPRSKVGWQPHQPSCWCASKEGISQASGVGKCPFFGGFGTSPLNMCWRLLYIPNGWVMLNLDICQPQLHCPKSQVLGGTSWAPSECPCESHLFPRPEGNHGFLVSFHNNCCSSHPKSMQWLWW